MSDVKQKSFEDITVVAIYGDGRGKVALPALRKTAEALPGCKSLLITNTELDITKMHQKIIAAPLDYQGYSEFVMYSLHNYIDTEYALIVQHDGWALDAQNWNDDWFDYDYVGGPSHAALMPSGEFSTLYQWCTDGKEYKDALIVQNGGFSLRSKKFLEAPTKHGIMRRNFPEAMLNNEDVQLGCFLRPAMENVGIKYAPLEVAKYFSFEHFGPIHSGFDASKVFGHHSRFRQLLSNGEMLWKLTDEQTKQIMGEEAVKAMFENHYGYTIHAV
jgi:hypothetical protein